uniref:Uncharacterized protein n=1 Tax=Anguilla anguilla TaxID=7936 RepID=A0A0E9XY05_ANGAN
MQNCSLVTLESSSKNLLSPC